MTYYDRVRSPATLWTTKLAHVPTWALEEVLAARGALADRDQAVRLPGLVVDPAQGLVAWGHDEYDLTGRPMELLLALALRQRDGYRHTISDDLARRVWRGWTRDTAKMALRYYVAYLRKRFPGLIHGDMVGKYAAYRLVLDEPAPAAEGAA